MRTVVVTLLMNVSALWAWVAWEGGSVVSGRLAVGLWGSVGAE